MFLRKLPELYITRLCSKKEWSFLKLMQSKHPKNLTKNGIIMMSNYMRNKNEHTNIRNQEKLRQQKS